MFGKFLRHFPGIYSKNYQFYWHGHKKNIYNIVQAITQNVVDFHDIANYQLIMIQWYTSTVYIRMNFLLKCPGISKKISIIKEQLFEIKEFDFPQAVKEDFVDTVGLYLDIFTDEIMFKIDSKNFDNYIKNKLELFDFSSIEADLSANGFCSSSLKKYFEMTKLSFFLLSNNLL